MDGKVRKYFEAAAADFDLIYRQDKSWAGRIVDKLFRRGMKARFEYITSQAEISPGELVVDVGCGSGRYVLAFAARGAKVVAIDFSLPMLNLARVLSIEAGYEKQCQFVCADFRSQPHLRGEVVLGVGIFDYLSDSWAMLNGIFRACRREAWVTFPKKNELKAPLRRLWLKWKGCPLYLYSYSEVKALGEKVNAPFRIIREIEGDYVLHLRRG